MLRLQVWRVEMAYAGAVAAATRGYATAARVSPKGRLTKPVIPGAGTSLDPVVPFSLGQVMLSPAKAWLKFRGFTSSLFVYFHIRNLFSKARKLELHDASNLHFTLSSFKEEARETYAEFCRLRARGDLKAMRELCTEDLQIILPTMVPRLGKLTGRWDGQITQVTIEKLRMVRLEHDRVYKFAQIMVRFVGTQSFILTNQDGAIVPNTDQIRKLDEYWIFERPLQNIGASKWRLQGRGRKDHSEGLVATGASTSPPS